MRIRATLSNLTMDMLPQGIGPSSGNRNYDVGEELSACFYNDLTEAINKGRRLAITTQRSPDVMSIIEATRNSHNTGQTITLESLVDKYQINSQ